ncbi:MAG: hypothetical protein ACRDPW_07970 [Mycobacteriales bacterium]
MSDDDEAPSTPVVPPIPPPRASLVGRFLDLTVVRATPAIIVGGFIGGVVGGPLGMAFGAGASAAGATWLTSRKYARKDNAKWREYVAGGGDPDDRKSFLRKVKILGGAAVAVTVLAYLGIALIPATAYSTFSLVGGLAAAGYLAYRKGIRDQNSGVSEGARAPMPDSAPRAVDQPLEHTLREGAPGHHGGNSYPQGRQLQPVGH